MRILIKIAFIMFCGAVLSGSRCSDRVFSPFFNSPGLMDPEMPQAGLHIEQGGGLDGEETDCRIEASRVDSVIVLDILIGEATPERVRDRYSRIELDVSVGLPDGGLVIADTSRVPVSSPGTLSLVLPIKSAEGLAEGENRVAVLAITRYLDPGGDLALQMGRDFRYCTLVWQDNQ